MTSEPASAVGLPRRLAALAVFLLLATGALTLLDSAGSDDIWLKTGIFLFVLFFLLGSGVWIGLALMGVAWIGVEAFTARPAGDAMITTIWTSSSSWTLTALPLFIWMGEILFRTRLSEDMFRGLGPWMARLPGGLLHTNVVGCTIFAAVSGSSAATLMTVGKMSIPELRRRRYPEFMTIGTLAGSATLGLMIPPSLTLIVYGVTINESITKLFIAGILPGLVLALMFMGYVAMWHVVMKRQRPEREPRVLPREGLFQNAPLRTPVGVLHREHQPRTRAATQEERQDGSGVALRHVQVVAVRAGDGQP